MYDEPSDEPLESLLREHLAAELDPQLGRAQAAFRQHTGDGLVEPSRRWTTRQLSLLAGMAAALAATIVVAVMLQRDQQPVAMPDAPADAPAATEDRQAVQPQPEAPSPEAIVQQPVAPPAISSAPQVVADPPREPNESVAAAPARQPDQEAEPLLVRQGVEYRVLESEIVELDSRTPVRKLRRQRLEQREYFDPQHGARMKLVVPREEIRYESIPTR